MLSLFWIALAYVLGSIPFGLIVARMACGVDPREDGSKNTGATNVARLCGGRWGVVVLLLDIAKGFVPVILAQTAGDGWLFLSLVALAAVLGHCYSVFLGFGGGKAVATTIGVFLALSPWTAILSLAVFLMVVSLSGYVSLGSLTLAVGLPVFSLVTGNIRLLPLALVLCALLFVRHRENIARLAHGQEKSWRKKDQPAQDGTGD